MKKLLGIAVVALIFFGVQSSKVVKADLVDDLLKLSQDQSKRNKFELAKWGLEKSKDIVALKSKEIKSLFTGNVLIGTFNDNQSKGRTEETYYEDGRYEGVVLGQKEKANWSVKQGKLCYSTGGCAKVYKHKRNPNVYFLKAQGMLYVKFFKIISLAELEKERKEQIEEERIAEEKRKKEERIAEEKRKKEERIAEEKRKEEERIAEEKRKKEERIAKEKFQKKLNLIPQKSELESAQNFLNNVKNFVNDYPDEFDIINISEFFILTKPILENIFEEKQKNDLVLFKNFTNTSSNFVDYFNSLNQREVDEKLKEIDLIYSELEFSKKTLESKLKKNPTDSHAKLTIDSIKSIEILLENPDSINQLKEYNEIFKTYIASLDKEEERIAEEKIKLNLEIDEALNNISELKSYLRKYLTSDSAPLIIEQVKLLEEAVEKEIFKDLVSANNNADQFIYKKFVEPEEKKAEDERIAKEKKAEEERIAEENRIAEKEKIEEEKRIAEYKKKTNELPQDQEQFIKIAEEAKTKELGNELQQGVALVERNMALIKNMKYPISWKKQYAGEGQWRIEVSKFGTVAIYDWIGYVEGLNTTVDGYIHPKIALPSVYDINSKSNNYLEPGSVLYFDDTYKYLIKPDNKLWKVVTSLKEDDKILFSGNFFIDDNTGYLSTHTIMKKNQVLRPNFIFRYTDIVKVN